MNDKYQWHDLTTLPRKTSKVLVKDVWGEYHVVQKDTLNKEIRWFCKDSKDFISTDIIAWKYIDPKEK